MRAQELIQPVEDIVVAIVPETLEESGWMVYLVNLKSKELTNILVTSNGYGLVDEKRIQTSTLRHFIESIPAQAYSKIEPIMEDVFGLNNEYWVSFYVNDSIYDKRFVFLPETIQESNFINIPLINKKGVMIK
jgi:hypothetical protein